MIIMCVKDQIKRFLTHINYYITSVLGRTHYRESLTELVILPQAGTNTKKETEFNIVQVDCPCYHSKTVASFHILSFCLVYKYFWKLTSKRILVFDCLLKDIIACIMPFIDSLTATLLSQKDIEVNDFLKIDNLTPACFIPLWMWFKLVFIALSFKKMLLFFFEDYNLLTCQHILDNLAPTNREL